MTLEQKIAVASMALNVVWFIYAMVNTHWTRGQVREMKRYLKDHLK